MSIIGLLDTTKLALSSFQTAIDVTGSNISNIDTPGYSRQRPVFSAVGSIDVKASKVQVGVEVNDVERVYDNFLRDQINQRNSSLGYYETLSASLEGIETLFNEASGNGINDSLNQFWNAWSDVSNNPEGPTERDALISATDSLCASINEYGNALESVRANAENSIQDTLIQVNNLTSSVAMLNREIQEAGTEQGNSNILQDKRDGYLKQLCSTMSVTYFTDSYGALNVFLPNGDPLVAKEDSWQLQISEATSKDNPPYHDIVKVGSNHRLDDVIAGGKIGALLEIRDTVVKDYQDKLNSFVSELVTQVNEQHQSGYDKYDNAGTDFFDPAADGAKSIRINPELTADIKKIAAASTSLGGGDNAGRISEIRERSSDMTGGVTLNDFCASLIGTIGQDVANAKGNEERQNTVMDQLVIQREAVSGVSIDEEMMKLIQYQMGYNAAGRLCSIVSEMLDTLINLGK